MANPFDTLLQQAKNKIGTTASRLFGQAQSFVQANPTPAGFIQKTVAPKVQAVQQAQRDFTMNQYVKPFVSGIKQASSLTPPAEIYRYATKTQYTPLERVKTAGSAALNMLAGIPDPTDIASFAYQYGKGATASNIKGGTPIQNVQAGIKALTTANAPSLGEAAGLTGINKTIADIGELPLVMGIMAGRGAKNWNGNTVGKFSALADKMPRFEIPDNKSRLVFPKDLKEGVIYSLDKIFGHDELYKNYPEFKKMPVTVANLIDGSQGAFDGSKIILDSKFITHPSAYKTATIQTPTGNLSVDLSGYVKSTDKIKSIILHEIQHAIQQIEKFATGGSPSSISGMSSSEIKQINEVSSLIKQVKDSAHPLFDIGRSNASPDVKKWALNLVRSGEEEIDIFLKDTPTEQYRRLFGEIEARDVQARMNLTPEQRATTLPYKSQGIPLKDQIVRFDKGTSLSIGKTIEGARGDVTRVRLYDVPKTPKEAWDKYFNISNGGGGTDASEKAFENDYGSLWNKYAKNAKTETDIVKAKELAFKELSKSSISQPPVSSGVREEIPKGKAQFKQPIKGTQRGFVTTVQESKTTAPEVAKGVEGTYNPTTNQGTLNRAQQIIDTNLEGARQRVINEPLSAETSAIGQDLIRRYQNEKQYDAAIEVAETIAKKATTQGQAIQALSMWSRLTPEGALRYAETLINRASQATKVKYVLSPDKAKRITEIAKTIEKLQGEEKILRTGDLMSELATVVPVGIGKKISTIQTMAQLLNPKTAIRNLGGNALFQGLENVSQVVATPLDIITSSITGKRSTTLPSLSVQAKGLARGFREGIRDAIRGIDTSAGSTQFDLPKKTFTGPVGSALEKLLNIELRAPDRAFYQSAVDESLNSQMKAMGKTTPTDAMKEVAHAEGLYKTFQDENVATRIFTGIKKGLNAGQDFGLGDLVLKYPKTPASLLMRGVDYSPAGFIKTVYEMAKPLMGKEFNQREFVNSFSRAIVGTGGLMTTGAILYKAGIISGTPEKDYDISAVQKDAGLGGYKINVSALKRFVLSGLDLEAAKKQQGDTLISYDWIQPAAIGISMGANIAENNGKVKEGGILSSILASLEGGVTTLAEQPLVQGVSKLAKGTGIVQALSDTIKGLPASFVPQLVNQFNQLIDNRSRMTSSPDKLQEAWNMVKAKVPGLAQTLPGKFTIWGEPMERYQGGTNTIFNIFANPAFVTKLQTTPEGQEVLNIFEQSGETQQAPRVVDKKIKINGEERTLTAEEQAQYQQYVGSRTKDIFNSLVQEPTFKSLSNEDKATTMSKLMTDINSAAKIELFGNQPSNVSTRVKSMLSKNGTSYVPITDKNGDIKLIDQSIQPERPKLTGMGEIDKIAISKYNSDINSKVNDIYDLFMAGKLTQEEANTQIATLKGQKIAAAKKVAKPTPKASKMPKLKAVKAVKFKKVKAPKLAKIKPLKQKKVKQLKAKTINLKPLTLKAR